MRIKNICQHMIFTPYVVCLFTKQSEIDKLNLKTGIGLTWKDQGARVCFAQIEGVRHAIVIINPDQGTNSIETACLLVHEATHIFQEVCTFMGESAPSSEFEAYSIQQISHDLMVEYVRQVIE